ncbi:hypothetical protein MCOR27_005592 [Pyricularia oryzae]|uniref:NDT80 domain-containing protein n=5 Tax=Pyricularia TaxID=48558 RepID=A0ABQ8NSM9_PYRGI|nr:uncharacterized protein MGG_00729 [Pyricularia oryzae 70-15]KAH8840661.1 hypothetical protein MCOR01_007357 [Pyricularia oryzae]KAI6301010.1 hypothetical protein MCOR33_003356 [Pyricularia grisea]EHA48692.1 hypothetical protein MGG_00729 [Pyricularia oryzae 70-15]KAI6260644.1 hypothetical protein MCOR19_003114 [Pyricularia oryzae]KAI6270449.1 hypothetical protein MCOR26_008258 [Pyricularia oryzae]
MSTTTYSVTMTELKEPAHTSMWAPNYGSPVHMAAPSRFGHHGVDSSSMPNPAAAAAAHLQHQPPHHHPAARPRNPSVDGHGYPYARYSQEEADAYDRQQHHQTHPHSAHPALSTHHSFPNLKRPYSHTEQPYTEMVQDLRADDGSKMGGHQDQKLLSFKKVQDKVTVVDAHGRIQQLEMTAQLHGMFFLSEGPTSSPDGTIMQPELTCYRRNLFQISGSLTTPKSQLSVVVENGEPVPVSSTEVTVSAIESVDGHPIRLIVIPWKTPPPNSPEQNPGPDSEPAPLPLIPCQDDGHPDSDAEFAVYPIGWRRLQFRVATANNGRRKELQQHFILHLKVMGTLTNGDKVVMAEATTAPIVVRGRSPRNFQTRKEIPLLGSSAGSRGQALVETGVGMVTGAMSIKAQDKARSLNLEIPRSAFTFSAGGPKMPPSPMTMRSNSYPNSWNSPQVQSAPGGYPATSMSADPYSQKLQLNTSNSYSAEPAELTPQTSMPAMQMPLAAPAHQQPPIRTQYAYVPSGSAPPPQLSIQTTSTDGLSVPRYVDSNPRPTKSPRHASHQSVGSITNTESSPEYRYGPPAPYGMHSAGTDISPHSQQPPTPYGAAPPVSSGPSMAQSTSSAGVNSVYTPTTGPPSASAHGDSNPQSSTAMNPPPRDYFPSSSSWTTTAGETPSSTSYTNGSDASRPYVYSDYNKVGGQAHSSVKSETHTQPQPSPQPHSQYGNPPTSVYPPPSHRGSVDGISHYSWNATN